MDPLSFQMLQLSTNDSLSQMTTPSLIQSSYFNNSNVNYNRQLKDSSNTHLLNDSNLNHNSGNNTNNNNNNGPTANPNLNTNLNPNLNINASNNNGNNTSNNNKNNGLNAANKLSSSSNWQNTHSYNSYLLQQQQQQQQQQFTHHFANKNSKQLHNPSLTSNYNNNSNPNYTLNQSANNSFSNDIISDNNNSSNNNKGFYNYNYGVLKNTLSKSTDMDSSAIENFKTSIQLKDIIIAKLESELEKAKDFQNTILKTQNDSAGNFEIPKNYEELYHKLVEKIQSTESELQDTKLRLESLVTAISMNPNPATFKNGRYDEEEISHKIISKLKMLTEENDELSRMLSYGKSKEKDIEIALLRKQNADLLEKVAKLETKLNDKK